MRGIRWLSLLAVTAVFTAVSAAPTVRWQVVSDRGTNYQAKSVYPVFSGDGPAVATANRTFRQMIVPAHQQWVKQTQESLRTYRPPAGLELDVKVTLSVIRGDFISGYSMTFDYSGGAHPNTVYSPVNVGMVGGAARKLKLADLLRSGEDPQKFCNEVVIARLNEMKKERLGDMEGAKMTELDPALIDRFVVTPTAVTWVFSPYDVGAYAEGSYFVKVPFREIMDRLDWSGPLKPLAPPR